MPGSPLRWRLAPLCFLALFAPAHRLNARSPLATFSRLLWLCSPPGRPLVVVPHPPSQRRPLPFPLPRLPGRLCPLCIPLPRPPLDASLRGPRRRRLSLLRSRGINFRFAPCSLSPSPCNHPISLTSPINSHGILPPPTPLLPCTRRLPHVPEYGHGTVIRHRRERAFGAPPLHAIVCHPWRPPMDVGVEYERRHGISVTPSCHSGIRCWGPIRSCSVHV